MGEFNKEDMGIMCDHIIRALKVCMANTELWKTDKYAMLRVIQADNEYFYETYPRICRILVFSDDITPLLGMIKTFGLVQTGKMDLEQANKSISTALNAKYIDNILNSDELKKERDKKKKELL